MINGWLIKQNNFGKICLVSVIKLKITRNNFQKANVNGFKVTESNNEERNLKQKLKIGLLRPTIYVTRITIFSSNINKLINFIKLIFEVLILVLRDIHSSYKKSEWKF